MALGLCIAASVPSGTPWSMASLMAITAACTEGGREDGEELASHECWAFIHVSCYIKVIADVQQINNVSFCSLSCLTNIVLEPEGIV